MSFDATSNDVWVLEHEYETSVFLTNNSAASMTVTEWTCSVPSATSSPSAPLTVSAGETLVARFTISVEESGLYHPVFRFRTNDDGGAAAAPTQLYIVAPAGSELEHDALAAQAAWNTCKERDPSSIATRNNYGVLLRHAEEYELAGTYLEDAVSDAINARYGFAGIQMNMGVVRSDSNDSESAAERYADVLSGITDTSTSLVATRVWYNQAWDAYATGAFVTAETLLTQTIGHPMCGGTLRAKAYVLRGAIYQRQGNTSAAESDYQSAMTLDPGGPFGLMAHLNLGLYDWNGDGIISIIGDVPPFVLCLYFGTCSDDAVILGDCNRDGIVSIIGDVPCFVNCVYFGNCGN